MADPQVPADAVQQAQVVLQNQAQDGQAPAALAEQAQAPVAPVVYCLPCFLAFARFSTGCAC